jgi:metallo-beta-lactamase class B
MGRRRLLAGALLLGAVCGGATARAQSTAQFREWNQPIPPFHVVGPVYYVGVAGVTSLLVTTPQGHLLVDGAFAESAARILDNVRALGFKPEDVKVLLSTHAHVDHAGGLAQLKAKTGARLYAGALDLPLLARGGKDDFAFGDSLPFPPVTADVAVRDGDTFEIGGVRVRALATPGHTMGCTSWVLTVEDAGRPLRVVIAGGTTAPGYRLVDNPKYPEIAADFERTFAKLAAEPADVFFEGHGFQYGLDDKRAGRRPWIDPEGYRARVAEAAGAVRTELEKQRAAGVSAVR